MAFYQPSPYPLSGLAVVLKMSMLSVQDPGSWFWKEHSKPYLQIIVYICSNLPQGYLKDQCKALIAVSLKSELRLKKQHTLVENMVRLTNNLQTPEAKDYG